MRISGKIGKLPPEIIEAKALWCVYGPKCFPSMICCKVNESAHGQIIWGFSIYKRSPGFRTLGITVETFGNKHEIFEFFNDHDEAIAYLRKLTTPLHLKV